MNRTAKLVLYVVCIIAVISLSSITVRSCREATKTSQRQLERLSGLASVENTNVTEATNPAPPTNLVAAAGAAITNAVSTNAANTNLTAEKKTAGNAVDGPDDITEVAGISSRGYARMVTYGLALLLFAIGLAVLIAYDVSQFLAHKAEQALFTDDGAPVDPEYDQAEEMWKDGKYLDSLNAMRSYLQKHPREQYVALRIAEIYEENLHNPLAAALEYEEVLKKKLPAERWGWAAIHLANLYSGKLNQPEKSVALLHRIDVEYGQTTAAKKARERLSQIDPNFVPANAPAIPVAPDTTDAPASNLPPGFRPKN